MIGTKIKALENITIEKLNMISVLGVAVLTVFYLFMINNVTMASYQKVVLQKKIENLRTEIRTLNLGLSDKRSIGFLKSAIQDLGLVVNDQIQYIEMIGAVAKNQ